MSTKIEWTDETWNPITGCTSVSEGCANCYARRMARRLAGRHGYPAAPHHFDVTLHPERLEEPLRWKKPRRVFVCSMGDLFHEGVEILDSTYQRDIFAMMAVAQWHTFQILTKRPHVAPNLLTDDFADSVKWAALGLFEDSVSEFSWPLPNVWVGATVENQRAADERIPILLQIPAAIRFVCYEPALGPVVLKPYLYSRGGGYFPIGLPLQQPCLPANWRQPSLDWVIAGGESGPGARPAHPDWFRSVRDQCVAAGVPFFLKQWGEYKPCSVYDDPGFSSGKAFDYGNGRMAAFPGDGRGYKWLDENTVAYKCGKKAAGHLLDGREWREFPERRT